QTVASLAGPGTVGLGSGTLTTGGNGQTPFGGILSGTGGLIKTGAGALTLAQDNFSFSGTITVQQGALIVAANNALGHGAGGCSLTVQGGTVLQLQGGLTLSASLCLAGTLEDVSGASTWTGP